MGRLWDTRGHHCAYHNSTAVQLVKTNRILLQPFTAAFPRADIHELIAPDLLHQIIKGTFKDHLVDWTTAYIKQEHPGREGDKVLADIDRRSVVICASMTLFS